VTCSVEASVAFRPAVARAYEAAAAELEWVMRTLGTQQENPAATAARRKLIELCVRVADKYGSEVRS
jgi:hypothetical protein